MLEYSTLHHDSRENFRTHTIISFFLISFISCRVKYLPSASFLPTQRLLCTAHYCSSDQDSLYILQNPDIQYVRLSLKPATFSYHMSDKCTPHFVTGFLHAYFKITLPSKPMSSNYIPFTFSWSKTFMQFMSPMRATCPILTHVNNGKVLF
jgi:hypothetical protein